MGYQGHWRKQTLFSQIYVNQLVSADTSLYRNSNIVFVLPTKILKTPSEVAQLPQLASKTANIENLFECL